MSRGHGLPATAKLAVRVPVLGFWDLLFMLQVYPDGTGRGLLLVGDCPEKPSPVVMCIRFRAGRAAVGLLYPDRRRFYLRAEAAALT